MSNTDTQPSSRSRWSDSMQPCHNLSLDDDDDDDAADYEAISYTWGDVTQEATIYVDEVERRVTLNAANALWHLRLTQLPRRLWLDSVCINQQDHEESIHQVRLIKHIYIRASNVLAWLGPASNDSDSGMALIEDVGNKFQRQTELGSMPTHKLSKSQMSKLKAVPGILNRDYWGRVWILQEVAVATTAPLVGCGDRCIPWLVFYAGIFELHTYHRIFNVLFPRHRFFDVIVVRSSYQRDSPAPGLEFGISEPVTNVYEYSRFHNASDPRDRIYALLGLMKLLNNELGQIETMIPDYRKSIAQIYSEATRMFIDLEGTIKFLDFRNHLPVPWLPSWVPEFTSSKRNRRYPSNTSDALHKWSSSGRLRRRGFPPSVSKDLLTLNTRGSIVDTVGQVIRLENIFNDCPSLVRHVRDAVFSYNHDLGSASIPVDLYEIIWRSLIGDRSTENNSPYPAKYATFYECLHRKDERSQRRSMPCAGPPSFEKAMHQAIATSTETPCQDYLISHNRLLGLGPPSSQPGDYICLLIGYLVPVLLRPRGDYFEYIGNAYIHGIMHGEGQPPEMREETCSLQLTEFMIR